MPSSQARSRCLGDQHESKRPGRLAARRTVLERTRIARVMRRKSHKRPRRRFLRDNGLSIVLTLLFVVSLMGQIVAGHRADAAERVAHGEPALSIGSYLASAHFLEATAENWESEFLQLFGYVLLTAWLFQRGSSESRDPDAPEAEESSDTTPVADMPWPVRRGGWVSRLYAHSLSLAFLILFVASLAVHAISGAREYGEEQSAHGMPVVVTALAYVRTARFWFESFQNWQSEFLALLAMVVGSIFLRERGSPESKPVHAPHHVTGAGE
jgi:hypothetical protein